MLKIEFDASNTALAGAIGRALTEYAGSHTAHPLPVADVDVIPNSDGSERTVTTRSTAGTNEYTEILGLCGILCEGVSQAEHNLRRAHGVIEQRLNRDVGLSAIKPHITKANIENPDQLVAAVTVAMAVVHSVKDNAGSADGLSGDSPANSEASTGSQSTTEHGENTSGANTVCEFDQFWQNAAGSMYPNDPIDPELGVPVNDKGFPIIDTYGVLFNEDWCQKAAKPFYGSGKEKGKWKARVGCTGGKAAMLEWHQSQLEAMATGTTEPEPPANQAASAFGNATEPQTTSNPTGNIGELMTWIGNQQAAGNLAQEQIQNVYVQCNTDVAQLAQPDNSVARETVFAVLNGMIGA